MTTSTQTFQEMPQRPPSLAGLARQARRSGRVVVQPRMGFSDPNQMRAGLSAVGDAAEWVAGTVTIDSYTRSGDEVAAVSAVHDGYPLNGYPITAFSPQTTRWMLTPARETGLPVQVRHGSGRPQRIVAAMVSAGLDTTEGGPISYCLPYGRVPLAESVRNWRETSEFLAALRSSGREPHLETFGGCLLGQLCPPGLLVAVSILEALFFKQAGLRSISLSYAQQASPEQDEEAVCALRRLAGDLLPDVDWHIVLYTYMGVCPVSPEGVNRLQEDSARLAVRAGAARLIVKTEVESVRIPTVAENVAALRKTAAAVEAARDEQGYRDRPAADGGAVYAEARALVDAVLNLGTDVGHGLLVAFARGWLDVPFCLHPDNAGRSRSVMRADGRLCWSDIGSMPIARVAEQAGADRLTAADLFDALSYVRRRYDRTLDAAPAAEHLPRPQQTRS